MATNRLCWWVSPSLRVAPLMGLTPTRQGSPLLGNITNSPKHFVPNNPTGDKYQRSGEAWPYQFQKPIVNANQARSKHNYFHSEKSFIMCIVLHLASIIQNVLLHLCVYIFEEEIKKILIQMLWSFHLHRSCLTSELLRIRLQGNIYKRRSYLFIHAPSKDSSNGEEKTKRHDSKATNLTPPFSLHLQEEWDGIPECPQKTR